MIWRNCNNIWKQKPQIAELTTQPRLYSLVPVYMSSDTSGHITVLFVHAINFLWISLDFPSKSNFCITHIENMYRRFC